MMQKELNTRASPKECTLTSILLILFPRRGAEHADGIDVIHFLEKILLKILIGAIGITGIPTITNLETIVYIYTMLIIVGRLLIVKMGRHDMDPRFRFTLAGIVVVLGCIRCGLLIYIPLHVMPSPIFVLRFLQLMNP